MTLDHRKDNKKYSSKEKIYNAAKSIIKEEGYKNTTMQMIAEQFGVLKGSVTYYFKKEEIISEIYIDFMIRIEDLIRKVVGHKIENNFQLHLLRSHISYFIIFSDENSLKLFEEIIRDELLNDTAHRYIRESLTKIVEELDININPNIFEHLMEAEYGARVYLVKKYIDNTFLMKSKGFIDFLSTIALRLAGLSTDIIDYNIKKANELLNEIDCSGLEFIEI